MAQLRASLDRPLFSWGIVRDRCYGHAKRMAGEDEPHWGVTAVVTHLNRRVRPVLGDHCLMGKRPKAARQGPPA
jgi:hypothetical protein